MTIFELGALGEFVGATLLFLSLIYVGLQIRQNTSATRIASMHSAIESSVDFNKLLVNDQKLTDLFWSGMADPTLLEKKEQRTFISMLNIYMRRESLTHYLYGQGQMPEEFWIARQSLLSGLFNQPGTAHFLTVMGETLPASFVEHLQTIIAKPSTMPDATKAMFDVSDSG